MSDDPKLPAIAKLLKVVNRATLSLCKCDYNRNPDRMCLRCAACDAIQAYESERLPAAVDKAMEDAARE